MKDRLDESKTMRRLMNEWKSLELCEDEILPRRAGEYLQLVQPKEFHRMVHYELHQEMVYLGWERSLKVSQV